MANDINLAALWVPVMPETSQIAPEMRKAGEQAKKGFVEGFSSSGGQSPEALGAQWSSQFMKSFNSTFEGMDMPKGMEKFMESVETKSKTTAAEQKKLESVNKKLYDDWQKGLKDVAAAQEQVNKLQAIADDYVKRGVGGQSGHLSILNSLNAAKAEEARVTGEANTKHAQYAEATSKSGDSAHKLAGGSNMAAAAIGGLAGAIGTIGIELFAKGLELAAEGVKKLGEVIMESGEVVESQSHQIQMYSLASGEALEKLEGSALRVYSSIDTEGKNVGEHMMQVAGNLGLTGEPLERLTTHLEELSGRFGDIDVESFAGAMKNFNVEGEQADSVLASWLQTARGAGTSLSELANDTAAVSNVLGELGLSAEQGAFLVAKLDEKNINATSSINKMQTAQKLMSSHGLTFNEGMKVATQRINDFMAAGNKAEAQKIGQELFGSEKLQDTLDTVEALNLAFAATPASLAASQDSIDQFTEDTRGLSETWENLKHQALVALSPLGTEVMGIFSGMLTKVKGYLDEHMPEIKAKAKELSKAFIDQLPSIIGFAESAITILGQFGDFAVETLGGVAQILGAMEKAWGFLTGNDEAKQAGQDLYDSGTKFLKLDFTDSTKKINEGLEKLKDNLPEIIDGVTDFGGAMKDVPDNISPSITPSITPPPAPGWGMPGIAPPAVSGPPGGQQAPTGKPGVPGPLVGGPPPAPPVPGGVPPSRFDPAPLPLPNAPVIPGLPNHPLGQPGPAPLPNGTSPFDPIPLPIPNFPHAAPVENRSAPPPPPNPSWGETMSETPPYMFIPIVGTWISWFMDHGEPPPANASGASTGSNGQSYNIAPSAYSTPMAPPQESKEDRIAQNKALAQQYFSSYFDASEWPAFEALEMKEAGFDNLAANPSSSARGMGQFMNDAQNGNTWATMGIDQTTDPAIQLDAMFRYIAMKYGTPSAALQHHLANNWYATGGTVGMHPGMPKGNDTVPIWAEPGEEIINAEMSAKHRMLLRGINAGHFQPGGTVVDPNNSPGFYGLPQGSNSGGYGGGGVQFPPWVYQLGAQFNLRPSTYPGHQEKSGFNRGIDWSGSVADMDRFARWLTTVPGMDQVIWNNPTTGVKIGVANGQLVGPGTSQPGYYRDDWGGHQNHVHTSQHTPIGGGGAGFGYGGPYDGSSGQYGQYPGMPGQYGGYGTYGGQTYDNVRQNEQKIQDAKDRLSDLDWDIQQKNLDIAAKKAKLDELNAATDALGYRTATAEQIAAAEKAYADSTHDLTVLNRERGQQTDKIADAERGAAEDALKAPKYASDKGTGSKDGKLFSTLGGGLIKGMAQELGFGDVFAKDPSEWGITKLLGSVAGWGLGTANAWADQIGAGKTGIGGPGWGNNSGVGAPGFASGGTNLLGGLMGSFGIPSSLLPSNNIGGAPNVSNGPNVNVDPNSTAHGTGAGQQPGPGGDVYNQTFPVTQGTGVDAAGQYANSRANPLVK